MKAITIWQPYAQLVVLGVKTIETRSWPAPKGLIGQRIAIHAAKREPGPAHALGDLGCTEDGDWALHDYERGGSRWLPLPLGAVVGSAVLTACVPMVEPFGEWPGPCVETHGFYWIGPHGGDCRDVTDQLPYGIYEPGRWAWMLADPTPCNPVPARGMQRVWNWDTPQTGGEQ